MSAGETELSSVSNTRPVTYPRDPTRPRSDDRETVWRLLWFLWYNDYSAPIRERSIVMSVSVCLCVCMSAIISSELHVRYSSKFLCVLPIAVGSVVLWRRSDALCTSGFMDDVMFSHKPRLLDVAAQLKRSAHAALSLAIKCAQ